jgi:hypothetical protein
MRLTPFAIVFLLASSCAALFAQGFSGSIESGMGWWLQSEDLLSLPQTFEGKVEGKIGNPETPSARYSAQIRTAYDTASAATQVSLGEAWITSYVGPFDLSVGNQLVAWGSTDVFNPIDAVNPRDLALPIAAEKKPVPLGRAVFNGRGFSVDMVVVPFWTGSDLPAARWQGGSPSPPAGIVIDSLTVIGATSPKAAWGNLQFGGRFQATLGWFQGFDLGLTYYRGLGATPTASVVMTPTGVPGHYDEVIALAYDRYSLAGLDAVLAIDGGLLLKAEGSYKVLGDGSWLNPEAGSASAEAVASCEYTLAQVTAVGEFVLDWSKGLPGYGDSCGKTLVAMVSASPGSRWSLKGLGILNLDGSGLASPQAIFTIADGLKAEMKAFAFFGASSTKYGIWRDNALAEISLKYSF